MKRFAAFLLAALLLLCSCGESGYSPMIILPRGFSVDGDVISGKYVNVYFFDPYESIVCDDGGKMTLYSDETLSTYLEKGGVIELIDGENEFVLVFERDGASAIYKLKISCVMINDFSVEVVRSEPYPVGAEFDKKSVIVTAKKENGDEVAVTDFEVSYDFDAPGESRVDISYGGIVHPIFVFVK